MHDSQQSIQEFDLLQWGRGQVTAEMRQARAAVFSVNSLQWGRGQVTAEMIRDTPASVVMARRFNGAAVR